MNTPAKSINELSALHDIALFVEIARTASFRRASQNLGVSSATLSRRLAAMEQRFGTRLFNRTTRRVELTDAGRRYFERCEHLADDARYAQEALYETAPRATGHLRVSMPADLGQHGIGPLLPEFARLNPEISFELDLSSHPKEAEDRFDVAIRVGPLKPESPVSRRIGWLEQGLFAAPAYLEQHGQPRQPADLARHDCLYAAGDAAASRWRLTQEEQTVTVAVHGRFGANHQGLARSLAERGMGIAALAPALWRDTLNAGRLLPVLPEWTLPRLPVHAMTPPQSQPASVRVFLDFLASRFSAN